MPGRNVFAAALMGAIGLFCWQATQGAKPKDEMLELYGALRRRRREGRGQLRPPGVAAELLESALEGMLQNLDQHSSFINTSEWKQFRKQIEGKFGGIGIQVGVDPETGRLRVIAPMVGTPAYEAGVLAGDQIMEIDGISTEGMGPDKAVDVLTGRPGTEVKLNVLHEGTEQPETSDIDADRPGTGRRSPSCTSSLATPTNRTKSIGLGLLVAGAILFGLGAADGRAAGQHAPHSAAAAAPDRRCSDPARRPSPGRSARWRS